MLQDTAQAGFAVRCPCVIARVQDPKYLPRERLSLRSDLFTARDPFTVIDCSYHFAGTHPQVLIAVSTSQVPLTVIVSCQDNDYSLGWWADFHWFTILQVQDDQQMHKLL